MSNLFKSGLLAYGQESAYVIDNDAKIIRSVNEKNQVNDYEPDNTEDSKANESILNDAMDKAKVLRDDAYAKAAELIASAKNEAETIKEQAYQDGYNKGLEDGSMEAMRKADVYLENIHNEQSAKDEERNLENEKYINQIEHKIIDISCDLIKKLTGIIVESNKPALIYMINRALEETSDCKSIVIKVSDSNFSYISDNTDRISSAINPNVSIEVFADSNLNSKQCIIETEFGIIDLSVDVQVNNLINAIKLITENE